MTATLAPVGPTVTLLPDDMDWDALLLGAWQATSGDEADRLPGLPPGLSPAERRALIGWLRLPSHRAASSYKVGNPDPVLAELRVTGWHTTPPDPAEERRRALVLAHLRAGRPSEPDPDVIQRDPVMRGLDLEDVLAEIEAADDDDVGIDWGWWPVTIQADAPERGRTWCYLFTDDGRQMAALYVDSPAGAWETVDVTLPADATADQRASAIVERQRIAGLAKRPPGRPPAAAEALRHMPSTKRMTIACQLVEDEGWRQVDAARWVGVTKEALNRRLNTRRRERMRI